MVYTLSVLAAVVLQHAAVPELAPLSEQRVILMPASAPVQHWTDCSSFVYNSGFNRSVLGCPYARLPAAAKQGTWCEPREESASPPCPGSCVDRGGVGFGLGGGVCVCVWGGVSGAWHGSRVCGAGSNGGHFTCDGGWRRLFLCTREPCLPARRAYFISGLCRAPRNPFVCLNPTAM